MVDSEKKAFLLQVQDLIDDEHADKAILSLGRAYLEAEFGGDPVFFANILNKLGRAHFSLGSNDISLDYYLKALDLLVESEDDDDNWKAEFYNNIGTLYGTIGEREKALESKFKALEISRRCGNSREISRAINNIGEEYRRMGFLDKAAGYYRESLEVDISSGDEKYQAISYHNLALVAEASGDMDGAIALYSKSLGLSRAVNNREQVIDTLMSLGAAIGDVDRLREALAMARANGYRALENSCLEFLVGVYEKRNELDLAFGYLKQYSESAAALASEAQKQESVSVSLKHDLEIDRKKMTHLKAESEHLRLIIDTVPAYIYAMDDDGRFVLANRAFADRLGTDPRDLIGRRVEEFGGQGAQPMVNRAANLEVIGSGSARVVPEEEKPRQDGTPGWFQTTMIPYRHPVWERPAALCVSVDITERRRNEDLIRYMAHHDSLTGIPNRVLFMDRLNQAVALARREHTRLALMFMDLDRFKRINDAYGHAIGDLVLKEAAARLSSHMRDSDTVGRIGGDEFVAFAQGIEELPDVERVIAKIRHALDEPFLIEGLALDMTASIGYSLFPDQADDPAVLINLADAAMYEAKKARGAGADRSAD